ncbi:MAG: prolipoprotein diacylglyceryl transferase [Candidatus Azobacteroides sp.]|nr:prolipoprotein diacylglyceryl transferase [Candidatus Azobacteroides sp.]
MNTRLFIEWNADPAIIKGTSLGYYNLLFVGGIFLCAYIIKKIFNKENIPESNYYTLFWYCFWGIIIGARLGHCLFYEPEYYLHHPLEMVLPVSFEGGKFAFTGYRGLASHGGTIGLIIALLLFSGKTKMNLIKTLDYIAIVAPLGACFIRIGNLMNSEIIGKATDVPWAFIFTRVDFVPRHPAQLYEAVAYLCFFFLMLYLYKKRRETLKTGFLFGLVLTLIFSFRFFIEFFKERQVDFEDNMFFDMGQLLSIPFILVGLYFIFMYRRIAKPL